MVAISPDGSSAYVLDQNGTFVDVIDTSTDTLATQIPVGAGPTSAAITPDESRLDVANNSSHILSVVSTSTNSVVASAVPRRFVRSWRCRLCVPLRR